MEFLIILIKFLGFVLGFVLVILLYHAYLFVSEYEYRHKMVRFKVSEMKIKGKRKYVIMRNDCAGLPYFWFMIDEPFDKYEDAFRTMQDIKFSFK